MIGFTDVADSVQTAELALYEQTNIAAEVFGLEFTKGPSALASTELFEVKK